jgi:DNA-binding XRE family transcriptional regulator
MSDKATTETETTTLPKADRLPRVKDFLAQQLGDPAFADAYAEAQREVRFGLSLYELREARGVTQLQLQERTGIPQETISRIERGRIPSLATLRKLAVGVDACVLIQPDGGVTLIPIEDMPNIGDLKAA